MTKRVVMFVDMVNSTRLKYVETEQQVETLNRNLFNLIDIQCGSNGKEFIKFTGDGAMVTFPVEENGCYKALKAAELIVQGVDKQNIGLELPRIHIRIGIATGECHQLNEPWNKDLIGPKVDLAARLCAEANQDGILVDKETKDLSTKDSPRLYDHQFEPCVDRLLLEGIPKSLDEEEEKKEKFFYFKAERFIRPLNRDPYSDGLIAFYPDRKALERDFSTARWIYMAAPDSTMLIAGRTLIAWTRIAIELKSAARKKRVKFRFLLSSEQACSYLEEQQIKEIKIHLPKARKFFSDLVEAAPEHFEFRESDQLILDGITCGRILLPPDDRKNEGRGKLVAAQDINAAFGKHKATALWACTCNEDVRERADCMEHGLYCRTRLIFEKSKVPTREEEQ